MTKTQHKPVSILMVGIGGYGYLYLKALLEEVPPESFNLCGVVDPIANQSGHFTELQHRNVSIFPTIEDFYSAGQSADLVVIASPIHYHVRQACTALKHGSNVLCEKPIAGTIQEMETLFNARDESGKWVMIGYQWSYSRAIQMLKKDIMQGLFGKPIYLKTLCFWPRDDVYYSRNDWAGKIKSDDGAWILDSPVNNAMAHFLHNLFYVLGSEIHLSAIPQEVTAESYRAAPIENYDTAVCRIVTTSGTELLFYGSHVMFSNEEPMFHFEFENAIISFRETSDYIIAVDKKGNSKAYGSPDDTRHFQKLFDAIKMVHTFTPIICGLEAARSQTLCMNGVQESVLNIPTFPKSMIRRLEEEKRWWVKGLDIALFDCYQKGILPNEAGYSWAKKGKTISLTNYHYFPGGISKE